MKGLTLIGIERLFDSRFNQFREVTEARIVSNYTVESLDQETERVRYNTCMILRRKNSTCSSWDKFRNICPYRKFTDPDLPSAVNKSNLCKVRQGMKYIIDFGIENSQGLMLEVTVNRLEYLESKVFFDDAYRIFLHNIRTKVGGIRKFDGSKISFTTLYQKILKLREVQEV